MGQVALGFRSLLFRALVFFIMAALLAWALGGTLWPRPAEPVCRSLQLIPFANGTWHWTACMDTTPLKPGDSPLKYVLVERGQSGNQIKWRTLENERIVEILPLLTANDQLVAFASNQTSGTSAWYRIRIDSNGSVSKPEKLADRLAAYQAWSALASLNNN